MNDLLGYLEGELKKKAPTLKYRLVENVIDGTIILYLPAWFNEVMGIERVANWNAVNQFMTDLQAVGKIAVVKVDNAL